MGRLSIHPLPAILLSTAVFGGDPALARPQSAEATTHQQTLFSCHADKLYTLRATTGGDSDKAFVTASHRRVDEEIKLIVDVKSRQLSLVVQIEGGSAQTHVLRDLTQGSSLGSGAGGRADTTIRGRDATGAFTIFAQYDNNGFDHDAALQVSGREETLLTCDSDLYAAPLVKGIGRSGSTNIYVLAADGVAAEMGDLPVEPNTEEHP